MGGISSDMDRRGRWRAFTRRSLASCPECRRPRSGRSLGGVRCIASSVAFVIRKLATKPTLLGKLGTCMYSIHKWATGGCRWKTYRSRKSSMPSGWCLLSNVPPPMLEKMLLLREKMGLRKPACYQGDYNLITGGMETKLLPLLRLHSITYNAFRCVIVFRLSD